MKKVKKSIRLFLFAMFAMAVSNAAFASGEIRVVKSAGDHKSKLHVSVPESYDMMVTISDMQGIIIFSEHIEGKSVPGKLYNLQNLEDGIYRITTEAAHQRVSKQFIIENSVIKKTVKSREFAPYFKLENDKIKVNYLNETLANIGLTLEDEYRIYLEDEKENHLNYGKIINTKGLPGGYYTLTLESGDNKFKYYFEK